MSEVLNTIEQRQELLQCIASMRQKMINIAAQKGFVNDETIQCSQELDTLIMLYQRQFKKF